MQIVATGLLHFFFESRLLVRAIVLSNRMSSSFIKSQPAHQRFLNKVFTGSSIDSKSSNAFSLKTGQTTRMRWLVYAFAECTSVCYVKLSDFSF